MLLAFVISSFFVGMPTDRATFYESLNRIKEGMSSKEVEQILGRPDDTWLHHELGGLVADSMWAYGSDGHLSFPTLGHVYFKDGEVWQSELNEEPFKQLMPEMQLRGMLRLLGDSPSWRSGHDPLWVIRCVNALLAVGKENAIFCLEQFFRVGTPLWDGDHHSYWVMRSLFEVPGDPGYMKVPSLGAMTPEPPKDLTVSPRYPVVLWNDVPFNVLQGVMLAGLARPPVHSLRDYYSKLPLRQKALVPPDDPFPSLTQLRSSAQWPWSKSKEEQGNRRFAVKYDETGGFILDQVLMLVRHTYQPFDRRLRVSVNGVDFNKYHNEFLKLGVRWDPKRQDYVRRDGVVLADKSDPPAANWTPQEFNGTKVEVTLQRVAETDRITLSLSMLDSPSFGVLPEVLRVYDGETKQLIGWKPIDPNGWMRDWVSATGQQVTDALDKYLAGAAMNTSSQGRSTGTQLKLKLGATIWVEVATRDRVEKSGVLRP